MTAAGQVRSEIVSRLKAAGLDAAEAYEDERFRERSGSVVAVGAKQAELAQRVLPQLTEEELAVYKRGRNANVHAMPRSATPAQYHAATGLECLMGWLYLRGDKERAEQLFHAMMEEE